MDYSEVNVREAEDHVSSSFNYNFMYDFLETIVDIF